MRKVRPFFCFLAIGATLAVDLSAQVRDAQFKELAAQLAERRLSGLEENGVLQERALAMLDGMVFDALRRGPEPNLETLNQELSALVVRQPAVGEGYQLVSLGASPAVYALVATFSVGGPSAVRLYARNGPNPADYRLAARIDRFAQPDFFDDYLELVPIPASAVVFVTVAGRTDELQSGAFTAWRFDGARVVTLWASELLPQSSYAVHPDGFLLTYCAESEEDHPRQCRAMVRDRYVWDSTSWKRVEHSPVSPTKR